MLDKTITFFDKFMNFLVVIFFLLLIMIGGYAFFDSYMIYDMTKLDDEAINLKPKVEENYNFEGLREINSDVEGWITLFGTTIDYPVLHSQNNLDYLNLDYKKDYSIGGSIFVDYRNSHDFNDDYTILYGHNMVTGQMFSDIKKYEDKTYFNQHLYGVLYTIDDIYKMEVISLAHVNAYEDKIFNLITYINDRNEELVGLIENKAEKINSVKDFNKLILLSTCDSYGSNDRTVLLVRLESTNKHEISVIEEDVKKNAAVEYRKYSDKRTGMFFLLHDLWWIVLVILVVSVGIKIIKHRFGRIRHKNNNKKA